MRLGALGVLVFGVGSIGAGVTAESAITAAKTAFEQWVQTRKTISQTRADWQADKALLEQTLALLERELAQVREQQAGVETNHAAVMAQRAELEALRARYQAGTATVRTRVADLEARVRRLEPVFPPALRASVQPLLNRLPADTANTHAPLVPRVLALVTLLNEVDKFQNAFSVAEETRPGPDGREYAVQVLYAGLGQAWFVNQAETFAGMGVPGPNGWQWTVRNELASEVARAIRRYRNELPADFSTLPAQLP